MGGFAARVKETTATTGTGNVTLAGAVVGFQSFNTAFGTSATTDIFAYVITDTSNQWEIGTGHLSASTTLVRDTIEASSNSNAAINIAAGGATVFNAWDRGARIDVFAGTGANTWTKRPGAIRVTAMLVGGGAGGGSGFSGVSTAARTGGPGGGGGGTSSYQWSSALLGSTETVTVGAGGAGGTASTGAAGKVGTSGGNTTFGNWLLAGGGVASATTGGTGATTGGAGGVGTIGTGGAGGGCLTTGVSAVGSPGTGLSAGGGAGGAGFASGSTTGLVGHAGGNGSPQHGSTLTGGIAGVTTTAAGQGTGAVANEPVGGGGGGGAATNTGTVNGVIGGAGGNYGGGGGGGSASISTNASGAGGAGANGIAVIISEF